MLVHRKRKPKPVSEIQLPKWWELGLRSLDISHEDFLALPQISQHLRDISRAARGTGIPRRTAQPAVFDGDGHIVVAEVVPDPIPPPPPGADLARNWSVYLESSEDPRCRQVLAACRACPGLYRKKLPIEAFCCAAKVSPNHVFEQLIVLLVRQGVQAATVLTAINQPRVVQKTVEMALRDEGVDDRALFHKASGWTPTPKSAQTNITVTQAVQASSQAAAVPAPAPESTIRRLSDRFNEAPRLTAPAPNVPTDDTESVTVETADDAYEDAAED